MNVKTYAIVTSAIFGVVAAVHLIRIVGNWTVIIDGWNVPMWTSIVAVAVSGLLSFAGFWSTQQIRRLSS
jgi:hypothetical protein